METIVVAFTDYQSEGEGGGDQVQGLDNQGGNDSKPVEVRTTELISSTSDIDRENTVDVKATSPDDGLPCSTITDEVIEEVTLCLFLTSKLHEAVLIISLNTG